MLLDRCARAAVWSTRVQVQAQTNPAEVGMLLAPPGAALFLILSFLAYRFTVGKDDYTT